MGTTYWRGTICRFALWRYHWYDSRDDVLINAQVHELNLYCSPTGGIVSNTLRPSVPESCDPDWRSLMERCWAAEPSERPSFTEIANELRSMASKIPPKGQNQQPPSSKQPQVKS